MQAQQQTNEKFEQWCIVEIMGHNVFAGFVSERTLGGTAMIQVDVPEVDEEHPAFTKLFSSNAIYAISPTTEAHAREAARRIRQRPVTLYILPQPARQIEARVADPQDPEQDELLAEMSDDHWDDVNATRLSGGVVDDDDDDNPF